MPTEKKDKFYHKDNEPLYHSLMYSLISVVSIGRLAAFYVILVPMEYIPNEPPHSAYVIVSFCTCKKVPLFSFEIFRRLGASANISSASPPAQVG